MRNALSGFILVICCSFTGAEEPCFKGLHRPTALHFQSKNPEAFEIAKPEVSTPLEQLNYSILDYSIGKSPDATFAGYLSINPFDVWNSNLGELKAVYLPSRNATYSKDEFSEHWQGVEVGMKLFIDMAVLPVPVSNRPATMISMEISCVDHDRRYVVFSYLEGTPSYGVQRVDFQSVPANPNITSVRHQTWFASYRKVVEILYPGYHRRLINRMHRRYRKLLP